MAPLFSKVDLNKLWHDVQNEETLICAKFGKDLFNISKVIGCKKSGPVFFDSQCSYHMNEFISITMYRPTTFCRSVSQSGAARTPLSTNAKNAFFTCQSHGQRFTNRYVSIINKLIYISFTLHCYLLV